MRIEGARILVTGGSRGIGRALAALLLRDGARVVISARDGGALGVTERELRRLAPDRLVAVPGDVAQDADAAAMVRAAVERFGGLDSVVNNAAILTPPTPIAETSAETWRAVLDANVVGTANVIRHALPVLAPGGLIVNLSSTWGRTAAPGVAPYCASKFAVEALTRSLAAELPAGYIALSVNPGVIATPMLATAFGGDVSDYPAPESLDEAWRVLFQRAASSWNGRSLDLDDLPRD